MVQLKKHLWESNRNFSYLLWGGDIITNGLPVHYPRAFEDNAEWGFRLETVMAT